MSLAPSREVNFPIPVPDSAGIPGGVAENVLVAPLNDLAAVASILDGRDDVAGIIVEPLQRIIPPEPGFLEGLRDLCTRRGLLLVFDEIVTGFRLARGGAQERFGVIPDICTLGKVIGGGFPLAAVAARAEIMDHFDKAAVGEARWLMQLGTLSGNPIAAAAGLKTLEILARPGQYARLAALGRRVQAVLKGALDAAGVPFRLTGDATLFDIVFRPSKVVDYRTCRHEDPGRAATWNRGLREGGVFKSAGKVYPSLALTEADLELTEGAARRAAAMLF